MRTFEEFAQENEDWTATCAIYSEETDIHPLHACANTRPASSTAHINGFLGSVCIPMAMTNVAFARRVSPEGHYRFFALSKSPIVRLVFKYIYPKEPDASSFTKAVTPISVTLKWEYYPPELPNDDKGNFLVWLWEKSNQLLCPTHHRLISDAFNENEELSAPSFEVCEFCEHEACSYWGIFHQAINNDENYRMVMLPPIIDLLYHPSVGTLIHPKDEHHQRHNNKKFTLKKLTSSPRQSTKMLSVEEYARQTLLNQWMCLYQTKCPICLDDMLYSNGSLLPNCGHFVCNDCFRTYLQFKVGELSHWRTNPFVCPLETCRKPIPVIGYVKKWLSLEEMERVRQWYKDLKFPPCFALDRCLSSACGAVDCMRRRPSTMSATNSFLGSSQTFCDVCQKTWCELCLKRIPFDDPSQQEHVAGNCDTSTALKFCQRYLAATEEQKKCCEEKYPWIRSYAHARQYDGSAMDWLSENGQCCPTCNCGVERTEGCFHMQCPACATHFCYECGDLLVPPYYGTHHCWEQNELQL